MIVVSSRRIPGRTCPCTERRTLTSSCILSPTKRPSTTRWTSCTTSGSRPTETAPPLFSWRTRTTWSGIGTSLQRVSSADSLELPAGKCRITHVNTTRTQRLRAPQLVSEKKLVFTRPTHNQNSYTPTVMWTSTFDVLLLVMTLRVKHGSLWSFCWEMCELVTFSEVFSSCGREGLKIIRIRVSDQFLRLRLQGMRIFHACWVLGGAELKGGSVSKKIHTLWPNSAIRSCGSLWKSGRKQVKAFV